uniref:Uncharacterized protein n=1 Tax=Ciona savignyi TaxID=51511 RepID=H2Z9D7_CIOSA
VSKAPMGHSKELTDEIFKEVSANPSRNLTVFVDNVATQQQDHTSYINSKKTTLQQTGEQLLTCQAEHALLQEKQRHILSESYLITNYLSAKKFNITALGNEVIQLLNQEFELRKTLRPTEPILVRNIKLYSERIIRYEDNINQHEANTCTAKEIEETKLSIYSLQDKLNNKQAGPQRDIHKFTENLKPIKLEIDHLNKQRVRLDKILKGKQNLIKDEEQQYGELQTKIEIAKKKTVAQILRLRGRLAQKQIFMQQLEEEKVSLQAEV